jgi:hypothetical protein
MNPPILLAIAAITLATAIDPSPYDDIKARRDWRAEDGRTLALCVLGHAAEARGRTLAVYDSTSTGWRRLYLDDERGFHPWALELAEFDGDPLPEAVIGAYKATRFDPSTRNRVFVYDLTAEGGLFAKWLGSLLGATPASFTVRPGPDGRDRLVCVEEGRPGIERWYRWHGFGFHLEGE